MRDERACCFAGATRSRMWLNNVAAAILAAGKPGCPVRRSHSSKHRKAPPAGARRCSGWQDATRSEEHTSELQSRLHLVCRLLLEKKKKKKRYHAQGHSKTLGDHSLRVCCWRHP